MPGGARHRADQGRGTRPGARHLADQTVTLPTKPPISIGTFNDPVTRRLSDGQHASNVTGLVDDLDRAGLAHRRASASDRRAKTVHLTAKGVSARTLAEAALVGLPPALLRLSDKDQRSLARLLQRAVDLDQ